ncbi:MAG: cation transporter [Ignavibacteria bacterium]|nr:cation transporter [Ignavibacteria bacterium]
MKIILILAALLMPLTMIAAEQTLTMKVSGNCGSCKKRIVKAAEQVEGVSSADWDKKTKKFTVVFDDEKTNKKSISTAVLSAGYDVEDLKADNKAYSKLPDCCKYRDEDHEDHD